MEIYTASFGTYLAAVSVISAGTAVYDKAAAKLRLRRVPEATLLALSAAGGCAAMLLVMLLIRHKTRKPKFMIGLPVILIIQAILLILAGFFYSKALI